MTPVQPLGINPEGSDWSTNQVAHPRFAYIGTTPVYLYPRRMTGSAENVGIYESPRGGRVARSNNPPSAGALPTIQIQSAVLTAFKELVWATTSHVYKDTLKADLQSPTGEFATWERTTVVSSGSSTLYTESVSGGPSSSYLYYMGTDGVLCRTTIGVGNTLPISISSSPSSPSVGLVTYIPDKVHNKLLIWGPLSSHLEFYDLTSLSRVTAWPQKSTCSYYLKDSLAPDSTLFHTTATDGALVKLDIGPVSGYIEVTKITLNSVGVSQLMNLGSFAMIALMDRLANTNGQLRIFYKANLVEVILTSDYLFQEYIPHTFCVGQTTTEAGFENVFFSLAMNTDRIQNFYLSIPSTPTDNCIGRDSVSRICSSCPVGAYLDTSTCLSSNLLVRNPLFS